MKPNIDAIKLKPRFDVDKLKQDLSSAEAIIEWMDKPSKDGRYYKWNAIPLYTVNGEINQKTISKHASLKAADYQPTVVLERCPYFKSILDDIQSPKLRVRLMRLESGGKIGLHCDPGYGLAKKNSRLHIPIATNKDVMFELNQRVYQLEPGTLWYLNTTKAHQVHNNSPHDRVHLVIDVQSNDWLKTFFQEQSETIFEDNQG